MCFSKMTDVPKKEEDAASRSKTHSAVKSRAELETSGPDDRPAV